MGQPRRHWLAELEREDIPCGPINDYAEVFSDPQVAARRMVVQTDHPVLGTISTLGSAFKLSGTPPDPTRRAPLLGEHTEEVLGEHGFSKNEIDRLRQA